MKGEQLKVEYKISKGNGCWVVSVYIGGALYKTEKFDDEEEARKYRYG